MRYPACFHPKERDDTMTTKRKGILGRIGDSIGKLMRQPMSDESNETPSAKSVREAKAVAGGKKRSAKKKTGSRKTKKR
jgi:hypothetical protein